MKYTLISGSCGAIGTHIKSFLLANNHHILELDANGTDPIDATNENEVKLFFEKHKDKQIDTIINCIGIPDAVPLSSETILDIEYKNFNTMININLCSIFLIIKECYKFNKMNLKNIINISSLYSIVSPRIDLYNGKIKNPAYTASKHGLIGLTKHLAIVLANDNIRINCIAPGAVTETLQDSSFTEKYIQHVPSKQTISIQEITHCISFLLNVVNVTGQNIIIDGGYSLI